MSSLTMISRLARLTSPEIIEKVRDALGPGERPRQLLGADVRVLGLFRYGAVYYLMLRAVNHYGSQRDITYYAIGGGGQGKMRARRIPVPPWKYWLIDSIAFGVELRLIERMLQWQGR